MSCALLITRRRCAPARARAETDCYQQPLISHTNANDLLDESTPLQSGPGCGLTRVLGSPLRAVRLELAFVSLVRPAPTGIDAF